MSRVITAGFATALANPSTQIVRLWHLIRTDGVEYFFTTNDKGVVFEGNAYSPVGGFSMSATETAIDWSVDNATLTAFLNGGGAAEQDVRNGRFDGAEIRIRLVFPKNLALGDLKLISGNIGNVRFTDKGIYESEFRSLMQKYVQVIGRYYQIQCDVDLGSPWCRVPIEPAEVLANTSYQPAIDAGIENPRFYETGGAISPAFVRARDINLTTLTVTNGDAETGTTGWTNEVGTLTTAGTPTPHGGSALFKGTDTDTQTKAYQDVAVPGGEITAVDAGTRALRVTWWQQSTGAGDDQAQITVRFFDGAPGSQIGAEVSTGLADGGIGSWVQFSTTVDIPALTRTFRIAMDMEGNGVSADAFIDDVTASMVDASTVAADWQDRIYECTTGGTTTAEQPAFDTVVGNTTAWGTAVFTAREAWQRLVTIDSLDGTEPNRKFKVTELTPNSGGTTAGRDFFPSDSLNGGALIWLTGNNIGTPANEIKNFIADDGITIEQTIELFLPMSYNVQIGDTALVYRGCDYTRATCKDIFGNIKNYRGFPDIPGSRFMFRYPDARY